jgi:hypothetical protein
MTDLRTKDERPRGYVDPEGTTPTPFRVHLEREARDLELPRPPRARRVPETEKIPPPPDGYEKPATWKRVAESPEGTVLLATHRGWEPVDHHLRLEWTEKPGGEPALVVRGEVGKITWGESILRGVKLLSLRVPGKGDREGGRHG